MGTKEKTPNTVASNRDNSTEILPNVPRADLNADKEDRKDHSKEEREAKEKKRLEAEEHEKSQKKSREGNR